MSLSRILELAGLSRVDESRAEVALNEGGFGFLRSLAVPRAIKENWDELAVHNGWMDKCTQIADLFDTTPEIVWDVKNHMHEWPDGHIPHGVIGKAVAEYIDQNGLDEEPVEIGF
jgi:hypothetical protein